MDYQLLNIRKNMSLLLKNRKCKITYKNNILSTDKQKITISYAYSVDKRISYIYKIEEL